MEFKDMAHYLLKKLMGVNFNVMGLPIYKLSCMLDELGYKINLKSAEAFK